MFTWNFSGNIYYALLLSLPFYFILFFYFLFIYLSICGCVCVCVKTFFSCKVWLLNCYCLPIHCPDSQSFKSLYLKIYFSPIWYDIIDKVIIILRIQCPIWKLSWKTVIYEIKTILIFWPNCPVRCI